MKKRRLVLPWIVLMIVGCSKTKEFSGNETLWYTSPARYWNSEALHLGNGYMGVSYYGGIEKEVFELSEKSMWTGGPFRGDPQETGVNPASRASLPDIARLITEGKINEADELVKTDFLGTDKRFGSFTAIGNMHLLFGNERGEVSDYKRSLDLSRSLGQVAFTSEDIHYSREYFCSYPDRVAVIKLRAGTPHSIDVQIGLTIVQDHFHMLTTSDELEIQGEINDNHRPFSVRVKVINKGGETLKSDSGLVVKNADEVTILYTCATNYKLSYPDYTGKDPALITREIIDHAAQEGYDTLKAKHISDYQNLYDRVSLTIEGNRGAEKEPTDVRWRNYRAGRPDAGFKVLAFNLGRYLIISSSRPGTLPANLQGVWNIFVRPPWNGNYQSNINLQEIYWSCGPVALPECQQAYIDWIKDLSLSGHEIARQCYGTGGWVSHTTGNIWGHAAPDGGLSYGVYAMGSAWHCQHLWEQYAFSADTVYLKSTAYPLMKEAAVFYLQNLKEYNGYLVFMPSVSAEHGAVVTRAGLRASSSSSEKNRLFNLPAPAQDTEMLWDLFTNTMEAATILRADPDFRKTLSEARDKLYPLQTGRFGQLQEWASDIDDTACHHRHIAHLYAVCPGREINPITDTALAGAAKKALEMRGDKRYLNADPASGGNWSLAHRMWCWGRLLEAEKANAIFTYLLTVEGFPNLLTFQQAGYHWEHPEQYKENDSLYCHFQLDASASVPGFMAEMLLQSHLGEIHLLPALPNEFRTGSVKGLRARGGYKVDMEWKNGELVHATITSPHGITLPPVRVKGKVVDLKHYGKITVL